MPNQDIVSKFLFESPWGGVAVGFICIIFIIFLILLMYKKFRKPVDKGTFKEVSLIDTLSDDLKTNFKFRGIKVNSLLTEGPSPIGYVKSWYRAKGEFEPQVYDENEHKLIINEKAEKQKYDMHFFKVTRHNSKALAKIGLGGKYFLIVDTKHLEPSTNKRLSHVWMLKSNIQFTMWGGVFFTCEDAREFLSDVSWKKALEDIQIHLQNFPNKVIYEEVEHNKKIDKMAQKQIIQQRGWEKSKKGLGVDEEAESEEEA